MLKKRIVSLFASVCILVGSAVSVSAISATTDPSEGNDSSPWGACLPQYSNAPVDVTNWGGHTVAAAKRDDGNGNCLRVQNSGANNWVFLGHGAYPANIFTAGTEYTISFEYLPGPYGFFWPEVNLTITVGGTEVKMTNMDAPGSKTWKTYSADVTATNAISPTLKLVKDKADIYIDNIVVKEKATGNVVYSHNFDMLKTSQAGWWYDPGKYAETEAVQFYNWPANPYVGIIEHGDGYAAYFRNGGVESHWSNSALTAAASALPAGNYKVMFDYIFCDANSYDMPGIAERITWKENWTPVTTGAGDGVWQTYSADFTKASDAQGLSVGWKLVGSGKSAKVCVDNYRIVDSDGKVVLQENFDCVPAWNALNEFSAAPITIAQQDGKIKASVDVTNSCTDTKKVYLIMAVYSSDTLENAEIVSSDVVGDPTGTNAVTTVSHEISADGATGKVIRAFLWNGLDSLTPLAQKAELTAD